MLKTPQDLLYLGNDFIAECFITPHEDILPQLPLRQVTSHNGFGHTFLIPVGRVLFLPQDQIPGFGIFRGAVARTCYLLVIKVSPVRGSIEGPDPSGQSKGPPGRKWDTPLGTPPKQSRKQIQYK